MSPDDAARLRGRLPVPPVIAAESGALTLGHLPGVRVDRPHAPSRPGRGPRPLFRTYGGPAPPWPRRRAAMLASCGHLEEFGRRRDPEGPGVRQWRERARATADRPKEPPPAG